MKNAINYFMSTILGLFLIGMAFYYDWEPWVMFSLIGIGVILVVAKEKISPAVGKAIDKFLK